MPEAPLIALDGGPLVGPPGGIQRFTQELFRALPEVWPDARFVALSDQMEPRPWGLARKWWAWGLRQQLKKRRAALFHGTDFTVPYFWPVCPSVMTVHDTSPWLEPSAANARVRERTGWLFFKQIPTLIHTPSVAVKLEVVKMFAWPPERIEAIPLAAAQHLRPTTEKIWQRPYILYVGALEERKNLGVLLEAAKELWAQGNEFDLLLAGKARPGYRLDDGERVVKLGFVEEGKLAAYYSGAACTVYPSRYEGFGLPVLEAMQCGSPVVTSDIPVLRETGGDAALYAKPGEWAQQIRHAMNSEELRAKGFARAKQFSWRLTAARMKALYERAIG